VESFASILSEARKYHLCLIMAHQYIAQLTDVVREAVFGNMGTIITFRVGSPDAQYMETEFGPRFMPEDLINIPKYNIYLKLLIDGVTSQPFSATTLPPIAERMHTEEKVIRVSRERYSKPRAEIEDKILKWSGMGEVDIDEALQEAEEKKKAVKDSRKPRHEYNCTECGAQIVLPVELDRSRPIYCDDCIAKIREQRKGRGRGTGGERHDRGPSMPPPSERPITEGELVQKVAQGPAISLNTLADRAEIKPPATKAPPAQESRQESQRRPERREDRRLQKHSPKPASSTPTRPSASPQPSKEISLSSLAPSPKSAKPLAGKVPPGKAVTFE
jgi:CxxC-x17-CxxC domain-containing protein